MSANVQKPISRLPEGAAFERGVRSRNRRAGVWRSIFAASTLIAIFVLLTLLYTLIDKAFGLVIVDSQVDPATLTIDGAALESLDTTQMATIISENLSKGRLIQLIAQKVLGRADSSGGITDMTISELFAGKGYAEDVADLQFRALDTLQLATILQLNLSPDDLHDLILSEIVGYELLQTYPLHMSILNRGEINADLETYRAENHPNARTEFRSWLTLDFLTNRTSDNAAATGIRTALLGTFYLLVITITAALPLGVGAAIYLEEYGNSQSWFRQLIETNIRNLAGVPSIIYGMLGLVLFVRLLGDITNGRSILAGGLTMALLILPYIIINAQEAIRAVPSSIREASYGLGATKWQTISRQVLPAAIPGIMTGTILGVSRAIGETAPLLFIAVSAINVDPNGPLSRFTALPIQIFNWTELPQAEWRNASAAAIIMLLIMLLSLNATAIIIRNRFSRRY